MTVTNNHRKNSHPRQPIAVVPRAARHPLRKQFDVVTIFPEMFDSVLGTSILKRAQQAKKISVRFHNPRDQATDKHRTVDDTPYGGGPGMVMKVEPIVRTLSSIRKRKKSRVILLSAKGRRLNQAIIRDLRDTYSQFILVCGHYEGVDERVLEYVDEEISIGDYVLTGGELGAMVMIDSIARLLPGVLGKDESSHDESHATPGYLEYPQYTRPPVFRGRAVPQLLLSGNHQQIAAWRKKQAKQARNQ